MKLTRTLIVLSALILALSIGFFAGYYHVLHGQDIRIENGETVAVIDGQIHVYD